MSGIKNGSANKHVNSTKNLEKTAPQPPFQLLFNLTRKKHPYTLYHFLYIFYIPFGICLSLFRLTLFFMVGMPLFGLSQRFNMEWLVMKIFYPLIGFIVRFHNRSNLNLDKSFELRNYKIIACNHLSDYDLVVFFDLHAKLLVAPYFKTLDKWAKIGGS